MFLGFIRGLVGLAAAVLVLSVATYAHPDHSDKKTTWGPVNLTIPVNGDFRVRFIRRSPDTGTINDFGQLRLRLWSELEITNKMDLNILVSTNGDDPREADHKMEDFFEDPGLHLKQAYLTWRVSPKKKVWLGKMKNPLFSPSNIMWDEDMALGGAAFQYTHPWLPNVDLKTIFGLFTLHEVDSKRDPNLFVFQPRFVWTPTKSDKVVLAYSLYRFHNIKGEALPNSSGSNTVDANNQLTNRYYPHMVSLEWYMDNSVIDVEYITLFAEVIDNPQASRASSGYMGGMRFGHKDLYTPGNWKASWDYRYIEKEAWLDNLMTLEAFSGKTDVSGLHFFYTYAFQPTVALELEYYVLNFAETRSDAEHLISLGLSTRF